MECICLLNTEIHEIVHESLKSNIHAQGDIFNTNEGQVVSKNSGTTFAYTSFRSCQENTTIKARQGRCNAIKFKKSDTLL